MAFLATVPTLLLAAARSKLRPWTLSIPYLPAFALTPCPDLVLLTILTQVLATTVPRLYLAVPLVELSPLLLQSWPSSVRSLVSFCADDAPQCEDTPLELFFSMRLLRMPAARRSLIPSINEILTPLLSPPC